MNMNFKSLLLGTSLSLIPNLTQAQCVATTDCATLGYTEKSCPDGKGIRCPFGTTYACPMSETKFCDKYGFKYECKGTGYAFGVGQACNNKYTYCTCAEGYEWKDGKCRTEGGTLGQCTGYARNCSIGQILNSDGTCTTNKESSKTPIGVVVYISGGSDKCGLALALQDLGDMAWATEHVDIPDLPNYTAALAEKDFDSCSNTQKVIKFGNESKYPAAWAVVNYAPSSVPATKGKWCLPAVGVARSMMNNYSAINSGLSKAGGESLPALSNGDRWNWSSTEASITTVWPWSYARGELGFAFTKGYSSGAVRPVIEF